jgi:hypothetical protein
MAQSRNYKSITSDITEGFVTINPIYLKAFDAEALNTLYETILQRLNQMRAEPFPYGNVELIRKRNIKLQRVYNAQMLIRNYARDRRIKLG